MRSVLIIDDDVKLCTMLREYLARHEIDLEIRHHGKLGLEAAFAGQYDLVLLDVTLPGIDGFEVLQRLRKSSDLCVLLLTARGDAADRIRGLQLGSDDYLPKPFDPAELVSRIRALIRRGNPRSISSLSHAVERGMPLAVLTVDGGFAECRGRRSKVGSDRQ